MTLSTLSQRVNLPTDRVESLLRSHADYFVKIGLRQEYTLNVFGECGGSYQRIVADAEQTYRSFQNRQMVIAILTAIGLTVVGIALSLSA